MPSSSPPLDRLALLSTVSPIGIGTYLGECSDADDTQYAHTLAAAIGRGITLIDTAINYRCQRSERVIGRVLSELPKHTDSAMRAKTETSSPSIPTPESPTRARPVVCTKGGYVPLDPNPPKTKAEYREYLTREYFKPGVIKEQDLVAGGHCIAPQYLLDQIWRSRSNLGLDTIDLYYLHNPEQQLETVSPNDFEQRLRHAFVALESSVADGTIRAYGCATWNGLRATPEAPHYLNLESLLKIARDVAGDSHHFSAIQLPINLAMPEAFRLQNQTVDGKPCTILEAAHTLGVSVVASAPLMQGKLAHDLPAQLRDALPNAATDAQRAIAFVRQLPGVTNVLVGMRQVTHLDEVLQIFS